MKKMVVFSLLVLCFPLVTFADTSESVPNEMTPPSQEQVVESSSVPDQIADESQEPVLNDTKSSDEVIVESGTGTTATEETSTSNELAKKETMTKKTEESTTTSEKAEKKSTAASSQQEAKKTEIPVKATQSSSDLEKQILSEWSAEDIRKNLISANYGIDKTELNGYTDQELMNALKLFARYNFDITGMDFGSYVSVLRMVYKDQTISWADAEKALAFNPNDYSTTAELAQNVDQLQAYLRILYSNQTGFLPLRHFTNEEMLHILNHLSGAEDQLSVANGLFSGLVHWLYSSQKGNGPIDNGPKPVPPIQNLATTTKPIISNVSSIPNTTSVKTNDAQIQTAQKEYPKTGEQNTLSLTILGTLLFFISGFVILKKRIRS
ncbi:hypothetical protein IGI39_002421 [Enterococcus sp. AZ135]